jgi:hypothetical protein|tara:strand:+ start:414 stop:866 length:453 start_codon:yes stop_codon:yes gene_type:complete
MSKSAFKLRSGNTTPFKQMGSSPAKQTLSTGSLVGSSEAYKRSQEAPVHTPTDTTGKAAYMKDPKNLEKFLSENPNEMVSEVSQEGAGLDMVGTMFHKSSKKLKPKTPKMVEGTTIFGKTVPEIKGFVQKVFKRSGTGRLYEKAKNVLNR